MSNTITLSEPAVAQLLPNWLGIRLQRGPNSTNLTAFTAVVDIPYVIGQTTYSYLDTAGASSDWYRIARYGAGALVGPFSPAWPVIPTSVTRGDGARRSLKNCRRMLGRRLGGLQVAMTTADGLPDGSTFKSTGMATMIDSNRYRGWWAMPTDGVSAGVIRTIGDTALNPLDGTVIVAPPFTSQIVQGTQVELTKLLPSEELGGLMGLRQALNLALAECWVIDRLALAGVANQATYDISQLGDWLDPETISEFYGPVLSAGIPLSPWGGFQARQQGAVVALDVAAGISTGATMSLELTRPADTFMKVGGVWLDGQQGFVNDDDECLLQPTFLSEVALVYCWESLAQVTTGAASLRFAKSAMDQRAKANLMKWSGLPHPSERSDHRATYGRDRWWDWVK